MIGTRGRIFDMSQAVCPCIVKQAIAVTFLSLANACAAQAMEAASLAVNSFDELVSVPHSQKMILRLTHDAIHHLNRFNRIFAGS